MISDLTAGEGDSRRQHITAVAALDELQFLLFNLLQQQRQFAVPIFLADLKLTDG